MGSFQSFQLVRIQKIFNETEMLEKSTLKDLKILAYDPGTTCISKIVMVNFMDICLRTVTK